MKQRLNILLITLLLLVAGTFSVSAQIVDENGQYVDTIFNDNIDRSAEDFVKISLLISEPAKGLFSPFGHTAFRLQCPIFDLDYVFHYAMFQSGKSDNSNQTLAYITGQFEVRLIADTFATYLRDNGRVRTEPMEDTCVSYTITISNGDSTETVTLGSIIPGKYSR